MWSLIIGEVAALYGQKANHILDGVLLFASYITKNNKLKEYPFPVLTISGDLDGLTRITRIVDTFEWDYLVDAVFLLSYMFN